MLGSSLSQIGHCVLWVLGIQSFQGEAQLIEMALAAHGLLAPWNQGWCGSVSTQIKRRADWWVSQDQSHHARTHSRQDPEWGTEDLMKWLWGAKTSPLLTHCMWLKEKGLICQSTYAVNREGCQTRIRPSSSNESFRATLHPWIKMHIPFSWGDMIHKHVQLLHQLNT